MVHEDSALHPSLSEAGQIEDLPRISRQGRVQPVMPSNRTHKDNNIHTPTASQKNMALDERSGFHRQSKDSDSDEEVVGTPNNSQHNVRIHIFIVRKLSLEFKAFTRTFTITYIICHPSSVLTSAQVFLTECYHSSPSIITALQVPARAENLAQ
jgi:hypothetical protein